jgi:hypothetical protein
MSSSFDIDGSERGFRKEQALAQIRASLPKLHSGLTLPPVFIASARENHPASLSSTLHSDPPASRCAIESIGSTNLARLGV